MCIDPHRLGQYANHDGRTPIPRDREVVLYCSKPHELTSARVALELRRRALDRSPAISGPHIYTAAARLGEESSA